MPEALAPTTAAATDFSVDLSGQQPRAGPLATPPDSPRQGEVDGDGLQDSPVVGQLSMGGASGRKDANVAAASSPPPPALAWGSGEIEAADGDSDGDGALADACAAATSSMS